MIVNQSNVQHYILEIRNILENSLFTVILIFDNCLKMLIKYLLNPLTKITLIQNLIKKYQEPPKENFRKKRYSNFMNINDDTK